MECIKAKPTTYKGIRFRSKSEARFACMLDYADMSWQYEPPVSIAGMEWSPDFAVRVGLDYGGIVFDCLVEYKPSEPTEEYATWWRDNALQTLDAHISWPDKNGCIVDAAILVYGSWYPEWHGFGMHWIRHEGRYRFLADQQVRHILTLWMGNSAAAGDYRFDLKPADPNW